MNHKKEDGFTLIELVIVIAVLGILALALVPNVNVFRAKAQVSADISTIRTIQRLWGVYNADRIVEDSIEERPVLATVNDKLKKAGYIQEDIALQTGGTLAYKNGLFLLDVSKAEDNVKNYCNSLEEGSSIKKLIELSGSE